MGLFWVVVLFCEENSVETIPKVWITENEDFAYWPTAKGRSLKEKIQFCVQPEPSWEKFAIRKLGKGKIYENYFDAKTAAKRAEETSDINNSDDEKRRRKRNPLLDSEASSEGDTSDEVRLPVREKINKKEKKKETGKYLESTSTSKNNNGSTDDEVFFRLPVREKLDKREKKKEGGKYLESRSTQDKNNDVGQLLLDDAIHSIDKKVENLTRKFENFIKKFENLNVMVKLIVDQNVSINKKNDDLAIDYNKFLIESNEQVKLNESKSIDKFNIPVNNEEELRDLEEKLKDEKQFDEMVQYIQKIGGYSAYQSIKRTMTRVLNNKIQTEFNWLGAKGKKAFKDLSLAKALIKGVLLNPACFNCTEEDVEKSIKGWLKHANDREILLQKNKTKD
ncbi:unnamed protein product [Brassicogethes aeneus]|uniref:DUF4806 domain-containing protein n=1 Tax=Brassicogethes aeneus TaxID=1431903 RepID=A0A9P0BCQ9_BRAAE|nr:unnamed protein product [Brassicogethes aeneus]